MLLFILNYDLLNHCFLVFTPSEVPPSDFTCTASSGTNTCENVYTESNSGWISNTTGEGSWIKLEFNGFIQISKIIYRHNDKDVTMCCGQNFKDMSFQFSDGTIANLTMDDVQYVNGRWLNVDYHLRINPPKLSSNLLLLAHSVYSHHKTETGYESYEENQYGISSIRIIGQRKEGKTSRVIRKLLMRIYTS